MAAYIASSFLVSNTSVTTGTAQKVPGTALGSRLMVKFVNKGANTVWIGNSNAVTDATGIPIPPDGESAWFYTGLDFYCYCVNGPNSVSCWEGA